MKLFVISAAYPPMQAGEATNTYHLSKHLADRHVQVHVLTSTGNVGTSDSNIIVHPIMKSWSWVECPRLLACLRRCSPDAVLLMYLGLMYNFHPMITFVPTFCKRILPKVPVVTRYESTFVGADPSRMTFLSRVCRKVVTRMAGGTDIVYGSGTLLRDSDRVIALCERHRALLIEEWPGVANRTVLIPPPPNMRMSLNGDGSARRLGRQRLNLHSDSFVVSFLGYLYPVKGIETLLKAFQLLCSQRKGARLLFIGGKIGLNVDGAASYFERMQALARELQIEKDTIWTGAFNSAEKEASLYLYASDICVLPFLQGVQLNNSSLSSIASHGLPLIVTRGPMIDKAFVDRDNVLMCEPKDYETMAGLMIELMDDPELRSRLRLGALRLAKEWFSWEKAIDRTLATFYTRQPSNNTRKAAPGRVFPGEKTTD